VQLPTFPAKSSKPLTDKDDNEVWWKFNIQHSIPQVENVRKERGLLVLGSEWPWQLEGLEVSDSERHRQRRGAARGGSEGSNKGQQRGCQAVR